MADFPLLSCYSDIFKAVLYAGDVRLMIVGYGFGDKHINAVIAEAVEKRRDATDGRSISAKPRHY
jgi:hypothetical protein